MESAARVGTARIAIVHEWLTTLGGSELVLKEMLAVYPQADLFALVDVMASKDRVALGLTGRAVRTTWMQRMPGIGRRYRQLLPLMPMAVRGHDLRGYDVVISNTHAVSHRVRVAPGATHLVHCCSPMRYAWDLREQYLEESGLHRGLTGVAARAMLEWMRRGDYQAAQLPQAYAGISRYIRERISRCYGREATVIYPPVDVSYFTPGDEGGVRRAPRDFYLAASRLVPYKKLPLIAAAFARHLPDCELVIIGDGPEMGRVQAAAGPNVKVLGAQPREVLRDYLRRARAFVFAADEDFGILPVEAQACGTPVIAYGVGGARETVVEGETGVFFGSQTPDAVTGAVREFEAGAGRFTAAACRANAERFSVVRFREEFREWVEGCIR